VDHRRRLWWIVAFRAAVAVWMEASVWRDGRSGHGLLYAGRERRRSRTGRVRSTVRGVVESTIVVIARRRGRYRHRVRVWECWRSGLRGVLRAVDAASRGERRGRDVSVSGMLTGSRVWTALGFTTAGIAFSAETGRHGRRRGHRPIAALVMLILILLMGGRLSAVAVAGVQVQRRWTSALEEGRRVGGHGGGTKRRRCGRGAKRSVRGGLTGDKTTCTATHTAKQNVSSSQSHQYVDGLLALRWCDMGLAAGSQRLHTGATAAHINRESTEPLTYLQTMH
jgi:hypothetical protein